MPHNTFIVTGVKNEDYRTTATIPIADTAGQYTLNLAVAFPEKYRELTVDDFLVCPYKSYTTPQAGGDAGAVQGLYRPYTISISDEHILTINGPQVENNYVSIPHRYPLQYKVYLKDDATVKIKDYRTSSLSYNLTAHDFKDISASDVIFTVKNVSASAIRYASAKLPISNYTAATIAINDNILTMSSPKVGCNLASQWAWTQLEYDVYVHKPSIWR